MSNLLEISESAWRQIFPNPSDETSLSREEFLSTARGEYAYQMQLYYWSEKQREGSFEIPSHLLTPVELPVLDNEVDISSLNVFRSFGIDSYIQSVGGLTCSCEYVKSSVNRRKLFSNFESIDDNVRPYIPLKNKLLFPKGTHANPIKIIYINKGERVGNDEEIDDHIGAIVRSRLIEIYGGKINKEDVTNNTNSNQ
jgi:hypothetical protein